MSARPSWGRTSSRPSSAISTLRVGVSSSPNRQPRSGTRSTAGERSSWSARSRRPLTALAATGERIGGSSGPSSGTPIASCRGSSARSPGRRDIRSPRSGSAYRRSRPPPCWPVQCSATNRPEPSSAASPVTRCCRCASPAPPRSGSSSRSWRTSAAGRSSGEERADSRRRCSRSSPPTAARSRQGSGFAPSTSSRPRARRSST